MSKKLWLAIELLDRRMRTGFRHVFQPPSKARLYEHYDKTDSASESAPLPFPYRLRPGQKQPPLTMQPNLNILLYVAAPDDRRNKVKIEVNRPTLCGSRPPPESCRSIPFSTVRERLPALAPFVQYLKPDVLEEPSESCVID